jgi:tetratricopeptide (TPR) repeat protein
MHKSPKDDFEITFFEGILKRSPKDIEVLEILGGLYTKGGRIDDGLRMDRKLVRLLPDNPTAHYNLACSFALKNKNAKAIEILRAAIVLGYTDREWMLKDPDLKSLKKYPAFKDLIKQLPEKSTGQKR